MERDPAAVLQAAIRGVVDRLPETVKEAAPDAAAAFQPAKFFVGRRPGFFFGTGAKGTGYYADPRAPAPAAAPEAGKPAARKALDADELLKQAEEQAAEDAVQLVDAKSLKRMVASFEKKYKENLEMRAKYAEQPEKFMESELDLDEEVQRLLAVAGSPELYPEFVASGCLERLVALLGHENTDIAADVLELFQQLTDADAVEDLEEEAGVLVDAMLQANGLELLVHRLTGLAEAASDEEQRAVFNALSILENMVELKPQVAELALERSKLLTWLLARLRPREFDSNKQSAAELLAILLQGSASNQERLAAANGIDVLLQAVAPYKNRDPGSTDEEECLENLFNCLCACLMSAGTRGAFLRAEGVELMLLILKQRRTARAGALKALDFATTRAPASCERFVDQFGLKTIFAIFMGKAKVKRRKGEDASEAEDEARALSVVATLFQSLARGSRRDRLAAKFVENEFEKCDRLMELFARFHARVAAAEAGTAAGGEEEKEEGGERGAEARLLARLEVGLYSLQQAALIAGHLWFVGDLGVRRRLLQLLHQKGLTLADVRAVLREFLGTIGDDGSAAEAERERARTRKLLASLGQEEAEAAAAAGTQAPAGNGAAAAPAEAPASAPPEPAAEPAPAVKAEPAAEPKAEKEPGPKKHRSRGEEAPSAATPRSGEKHAREEARSERHGEERRRDRDRPRDEDRERERRRDDERERERHRDKRRRHDDRREERRHDERSHSRR